MNDLNNLEVIAFDLFGTVFDLSKVNKQEIKDYVKQSRDADNWSPLSLPESWNELPAHPDSKEGIQLLRQKFLVATLSNGPVSLQARMSRNAGISWDLTTPIELNKVYKPRPEAYLTVCQLLRVNPEQVLMVTANKDFGDIEAAERLGMKSCLIRHEGHPKTITELARLLLIPDR